MEDVQHKVRQDQVLHCVLDLIQVETTMREMHDGVAGGHFYRTL